MITHALLALASLAPAADTPIEPITSDTIAVSLLLPEWGAVCSTYADLDQTVLMLSILGDAPELYPQLMETVDAWEVGLLEDALGGVSSRMTVEAEAMFLDALHGCV